MRERTYVVAQLGARMHYAVPRILQQAGLLVRLYTDFSADQGWPKALNLIPRAFRPRSMERLLGRVAEGVPSARVNAFNSLGLGYAERLRHSRTPRERSSTVLWSGKEFCRKVLEHGLESANAVYTFNTAGLEILEWARRGGLLTVSEQTIAPKQFEMELLKHDREAYPTWEPDGGSDSVAPQLAARESAEWNEADLILCPCEFVRESIALCGGPVDRCVVVPYGVDVSRSNRGTATQKPETRKGPMRVLTVGGVGLRKGSPYVLETAKLMGDKAEFRMVGPLGVSASAQVDLRKHLDLAGPVARAAIASQFDWADVFLLPSICEGSATVTYEAMAHGLPVICTPNTGSVVRDTVDGFIVPIRDAAATAARLEQLAGDKGMRIWMGDNARQRASEFTVAAYGRRLLAAIS